jgi:DNA uptake protein ComE-like DNA-binding protein
MKTLPILALILSTLATAGSHKDLSSVNVNSAPPDSLTAHLPGVGPAMAERIVAARPFAKCSDLTENVSGIGEKKIAKICPLLVF